MSHSFIHRDELVLRDLRRHAWWARYWSCVLLLGWAVWIVVLTPFDISTSYSLMRQAGEHVTGLLVGALAIISALCTVPAHHRRWWLVASLVIQGSVLSGIAATFAAGEITSTGVWVYGVLGAAAIAAAFDVALLPPRTGEVNHG